MNDIGIYLQKTSKISMDASSSPPKLLPAMTAFLYAIGEVWWDQGGELSDIQTGMLQEALNLATTGPLRVEAISALVAGMFGTYSSFIILHRNIFLNRFINWDKQRQ